MSVPGPAAIARCLLLLAGIIVPAGTACAQQQESELERRIKHPDMNLHFEGFERSFDTKTSGRDKQANVRAFNFGGRAVGVKGDGMFHARLFDDGRGGFRTDSFAVRRAAAAERQAAPQADRSFATGAVPVRADRAASKPAYTRDYVNSTKPFLVPGKRQDSIDDLRRTPNLSIDQVREILNKSR